MKLPQIGQNRFKIAMVIAGAYPLAIVVWALSGWLDIAVSGEAVGNVMTGLTVAFLGVLLVKEEEGPQ